ncbi:MAG: hypothetical protein NZM43_10420 [Saprospiraceae bacterium]|nr:hypothetical protein [Saprospiraceae bacterium]MDW8484724.1 hypothetical protein [Saprospiraceae bacterium]
MSAPQYDEFGFLVSEPNLSNEPHVPMRERFPPAGTEYLGGRSDGWEYRTVFAGRTLADTFEMIRHFLQEEGYGDVPLPNNVTELRLFRRPRSPQLELFGEYGYVHNPIKILFPRDAKLRNTLILCIYNERAPNHLLRFHGVLPQK